MDNIAHELTKYNNHKDIFNSIWPLADESQLWDSTRFNPSLPSDKKYTIGMSNVVNLSMFDPRTAYIDHSKSPGHHFHQASSLLTKIKIMS